MENFVHLNRKSILIPLIIIFTCLLFYFHQGGLVDEKNGSRNNSPYQNQQSYHHYDSQSKSYRIGLVADQDKASKISLGGGKETWRSILKYADLTRGANGQYSVAWRDQVELRLSLNEAGRGMELSDLCFFDHKLYSFDDRTGIIVTIEEGKVYPSHIMMDGNGQADKGFKAEWCTVKDDRLYIGGMGKEWTDGKGAYLHDGPQWVKYLDLDSHLHHESWVSNYESLRTFSDTTYPGYLLHEAVTFNPYTREWLFMPRRVSKEIYDEEKDEFRCSNIGFVVSEDFKKKEILKNLGPLESTKGFSSVKVFPHRPNELLVLKTTEVDKIASFIMVVTYAGEVLMPPTPIPGEMKYEGVEFL